MIPRLGQGILRKARGSSLKPLLASTNQYVKRVAPLTPALAVRSLSIQLAKQAEVVSNHTIPENTDVDLFNTLQEFKATGNLRGAVKAVQKAQNTTVDTYKNLVNVLRESPFDVEACATLAHWFYSPDSKLPAEVLNDINLWKDVLKLGFHFGSTYRSEDLRALVDRFTELFDLNTLNDQTAWELLMRAYGILNKADKITACMNKRQVAQEDKATFYSNALLAYAAASSHENVEKLLEDLKSMDALEEHTLLKLIRAYGHNGDITRTNNYINMHKDLFPETTCDKTMLLMAHKVALQKICNELVHTRGSRGLHLKPPHSAALDKLHASWSEVTKDMFKNDSKSEDIIDCNIVMEYLTIANRIDPDQFPMEKAEEIFNTYMPTHNIQHSEASHSIMLVGYATSQQYNEPNRNGRLDKALKIISQMQEEGVNTLTHPTFHALFRACIPHRRNNYYYDNFRLNSLLPARPLNHYRYHLDKRTFEIEKIMREARIPHDRYTLTTLMTCLGAGGQFQALHNRWNSIKYYGLRRDVGMYRLMFALCSLNPESAKHAIVVLRKEMKREVHPKMLDWETYSAMLDCCIIANEPEEAKIIMDEMRSRAKLAFKNKDRLEAHSKFPFNDEPDYYVPLLRTAVSLGLESDTLVNTIERRKVVYNQGLWEALLSKAALDLDPQSIQRLFNKYTMARFEKDGKIPIPVRDGSKPVIPFPSGPYNKLDTQFIDVYVASLLDSQDISLVMDVLRTLSEQTDEIGISRKTLEGITKLARKEKSFEDLEWFKRGVLSKLTNKNSSTRALKSKINKVVSSHGVELKD